ncbi:hypothetical protein FH593_02495 [Leptospira interrogans]|nr:MULTISPECIES: hypothetical protein [Leptospira]EMJ54437.1 hypothetical protein LEP1GSC111_1398 [Leptospira interrogans str. UT126]EMP07206.1 hypothetical protein LEP1GSC124_3842 [Leptospira interrogans serovar Pyrogenes str. 200701872]MCL8310970.1 hypothetical protein [Leptospira interrogans]ULG88931.1 hypothetical protein FH593_02495 [Leptospira interrogans]UML81595.1 hypothetical protein FH602_08300 [Leptospira kirschneri]
MNHAELTLDKPSLFSIIFDRISFFFNTLEGSSYKLGLFHGKTSSF